MAPSLPIADYALLSDCQSAALVSRTGSIDWLCFPRFDSPSVFARLLDEEAGHWSISCPQATAFTRRYLNDSLVLETTFSSPDSELVLTDLLAFGSGERGHDIGRHSPHNLVRRLECRRGPARATLRYAPRPAYGRVRPRLSQAFGAVAAEGDWGALRLASTLPLTLSGDSASASFMLEQGETAWFVLQFSERGETIGAGSATEEAGLAAFEGTLAGWRSWSAQHQRYMGPGEELVRRAGCVLQGLTYKPTGAIVAAPTTSLPESPGGSRNWDYRYAWLRDSAMTLEALWVAACPDEAQEFFAFMAHASRGPGGLEVQVVYGVDGRRELEEEELSHLAGWRDSRPVRIGNAAWKQRQIDVYGEVLSAAGRLVDSVDILAEANPTFLAALANEVVRHWQEPDQGIWEVRNEPRHFLYSKLMCWSALDQATRLGTRIGTAQRVRTWSEVREVIRSSIETRGWSDEAGAFTQAFDSPHLDASALTISLVGFLPPRHPRVLSTIQAIEERLTDARGLVYRYLADDGLPGDEGTFLLCTYWLSQALAMAGEITRAREVFDRANAYANDLGLLAEEVSGDGKELLGNFPQALSHIGLVNAAWALAEAERAAYTR